MTSVAGTVITVRSERNSSDESANIVEGRERARENENIPFPNFDRIHCIVFKPE